MLMQNGEGMLVQNRDPKCVNSPHLVSIMEVAALRGYFSVKELAAAVNMSPSRLEALFKRDTGEQIGQHLTNLRLRKAARMLESTAMRIKEITHAIGYEHPSSFVRAFRRNYSKSPRDYRKAHGYAVRGTVGATKTALSQFPRDSLDGVDTDTLQHEADLSDIGTE